MKPGLIAGGVTAGVGLAILAVAAVALDGPLFYWADPLEAGMLQRRCLIAGVAALLLGAAGVVSSKLRDHRRP